MRITVVLNRQEAHNDSLIGVYIGTENKVRKQVINEMCILLEAPKNECTEIVDEDYEFIETRLIK